MPDGMVPSSEGAVDLGMFWFLKALPKNLEADGRVPQSCNLTLAG